MISLINEKSCHNIKKIGGKGYSLQELAKLDCKIPVTLVLTTDFIKRFYKNPFILTSLLPQINFDLNISEAVFAVRSSAVCEFSSDTSWAGQFNTFLEIKGETQISKSVEKILSHYEIITKPETSLKGYEIAILIQEYIRPLISGILFTCNPVTSDPSEIVLQIFEGKCDDIASGKQSGLTLYIDKITKQLRRSEGEISQKAKKVFVKDIQPELIKKSCRTESVYKTYIDIEWSYGLNFKNIKSLFFLQFRPVTSFAKNK